MKRRLIAAIIALTLVTSNSSAVGAVIIDNMDTGSTTSEIKDTRVGSIETEINFNSKINISNGQDIILSLKNGDENVDINIGSNEPIYTNTFNINNTEATYTIKKLNIMKEVISSEDEIVHYISVVIDNLTIGKYGIELKGNGFNNLEVNDILLDKYSKKIYINDNESFLLGDINKDNIVNAEDYNTLFNNIDEYQDIYDLNKDNMVDITDLSYVYNNLGNIVSDVKIIDTNPIIDIDNIINISSRDITFNFDYESDDVI